MKREVKGEVKHLLFAKVKPTISRQSSLPVMSKETSRQKGERERKSPNWDSGALEWPDEKEGDQKWDERPGEGNAQVKNSGPDTRGQGQPHHRWGSG